MPDIGLTDVTVTVVTTQVFPLNPWVEGGKRHSRVRIIFGNAALTYPTTGIPLPTYLSYGLTRNLDLLTLVDTSGSRYQFKWDRAANALEMYEAGAELEAGTAAPSAHTLIAEARGW